jgi:hypothetical protein
MMPRREAENAADSGFGFRDKQIVFVHSAALAPRQQSGKIVIENKNIVVSGIYASG